jgi:hypothetical protein
MSISYQSITLSDLNVRATPPSKVLVRLKFEVRKKQQIVHHDIVMLKNYTFVISNAFFFLVLGKSANVSWAKLGSCKGKSKTWCPN